MSNSNPLPFGLPSVTSPSETAKAYVARMTSPLVATVVSLVVLVLLLLIFAFIGRWLWNRTLVGHVSTVRPIESVWTMLGIIILIRMIFAFKLF